MSYVRILAKLRDKDPLSSQEIVELAQGIADYSLSDAQVGAFAMATVVNGLGVQQRADLTRAMRDTGVVLTWDLDGPVLDKHSTGGVGDCVSLILAPMLASCGVYVPMVSGRGLGHTGGTLDKLSSFEGVQVDLDLAQFQKTVKQVGCAIVSASPEIAPADRRLYAIRDITATVPSLDLITASILSKKLAAGLDGLILDVKCGTGAFMKSQDEAVVLAKSLVNTACLAGCPTTAVVSNMNTPLASSMGNALEIQEVLAVLCDNKAGDLRDLCLALGRRLLAAQGAKDRISKFENSLASGDAAEVFQKMIAAQGAKQNDLLHWQNALPAAPVVHDVYAPETGVLTHWDGETLGDCVVALGGGRRRQDDVIDLGVGLSDIARSGSTIKRGDMIARVHANSKEQAEHIAARVADAVFFSDVDVPTAPLIYEDVTQ